MNDTGKKEEPIEPQPRRLRLMFIDPVSISSMFKGEKKDLRIRSSVPEDARVFSCGWNEYAQMFYLTFEHPTWDPVAPGRMIPIIPVTEIVIHRLQDQDVDWTKVFYGLPGIIYLPSSTRTIRERVEKQLDAASGGGH